MPKPRPTPLSDLKAVGRWTWPRWVGFVGWFVDWDDSIPFHYVWTDADTFHCTKWKWKWRLNSWFVCSRKGGDFYDDMCGRPDHQICMRCNDRIDRHESHPLRRLVHVVTRRD